MKLRRRKLTHVDETAPPRGERMVADRHARRSRPPLVPLWFWLLALLLLVLAGVAAAYALSGNDGDDLKDVPAVVRLPVDDAVDRLGEEGFAAAIRRRASDEAPRGIVFAQRPAAGRELPEGSTVTLLVSSGPASTTVPNVVGLPLARATERLRETELGARPHSVFSEEPRGLVVAQDPRAGSKARRGSKVRINVSRGTGRVAVPDLVGLQANEAAALLRRRGLEARRFEILSGHPGGTVVAQNPQPGSEIASGDSVRINVSTGIGPPRRRDVGVPDTVGVTLSEAQDRLQGNGFVVRVVYVPSAEPEGTVVAQRPAGGSIARAGSQVRLNVSEGPGPAARVEVPDVLALDADEATAELERAGFRVRVFGEPTPDPAEDGIVVRQEPDAGAQAPRGSQVTIYVGRFSG